MPITNRAAQRYLLEVDGISVNSLKRFSGLGLEAGITAVTAAGAAMPRKHVTNVTWTPGLVQAGVGMGKGLYSWMKAAFAQGAARRDGSFTVADAQGKVQSALNFSGGVITAITVPRCDAANKDGGHFDIAFQAEQVRWFVGSGAKISGGVKRPSGEWLSSNFKLSIGNLPCARVAAVEAFTWRCDLVDTGGVGRGPGPQLEARITVPDIQLSIAAADYPAWAAAAQQWFLEGKHLDSDEMTGRLTLLGPTLKEADALGWIDLVNVGFRRFSPAGAETGADHAANFMVELYVEKMLFTIPAFEA